MKPFQGTDFYGMDALLSDDEKMIRDTVRKFVSDRVMPVIGKHYRDGTFPKDLIPAVAELGLMGATIKGYECAGLNNVAYGLVLQELERGDSGLRSFVSVQGGLVMYPIFAFGSEEQKKKYLPKLAKAELIGCFGLTEPDFGSNPGGMTTRVVKKGGKYILNGTKMWITNGTMADIAIVWAKDSDGGVQGFIVDCTSKGFKAEEIKGKMSLRSSDTAELILQDVEVSEEHRLPKTDGLKAALMCLNQARYGISWGAIGAAMACYEEALEYSKIRVQFDKPIAAYQLVQHKLVLMLTEITKAQLLSLQLGRLKDEGKASHVQVSMAKRNNVWEALKIARLARDILGANGIIDEYQSMRHMCNLETVYTYEGTHDIHTLVIGQHITGHSAFS